MPPNLCPALAWHLASSSAASAGESAGEPSELTVRKHALQEKKTIHQLIHQSIHPSTAQFGHGRYFRRRIIERIGGERARIAGLVWGRRKRRELSVPRKNAPALSLSVGLGFGFEMASLKAIARSIACLLAGSSFLFHSPAVRPPMVRPAFCSESRRGDVSLERAAAALLLLKKR